jgi:hypothetical protein
LPNLKQLWRASLLFRRITAVTLFILAAVAVYRGSHIPRSIALPADDLNAKATARVNEEMIIITKPDVKEGDLVLSYVGNKNEIAGIWLQNAILDDQSQHLLFHNAASAPPGRISYTTGSPTPATAGAAAPPDDTCHTTIEIRRAKGSPPVESLKLYQTDETAGAQRFRQIVLDAGNAVLEIEAHTDAPTQAPMEATDLPGCHKLLTIGNNAPLDLPPLPMHMLVHSGKIDMHFNPANPALPIWTGPDQSFEAVSLGDNSLRANSLQIVPMSHSGKPQLEVRSARPASSEGITFSRLKLASDKLRLDVGRDPEKAIVHANGASLYNYDLIAAMEKNPILSFVFAAVLIPALWKWVRKNCFPNLASGKD